MSDCNLISGPLTFVQKTIPDGEQGVFETLKLMGRCVIKYKSRPDIRLLAMSLVSGLPQKNYKMEAEAIMHFVQKRIRYLKDVRGVETIQSPVKTLQLGQGDCDDKSTLAATLLEAIGHRTRFVVVGQLPGIFSHVYVETEIWGKWVPMELTQDRPLGWEPSEIAVKKVFHVKRK
jgi:Transglutaminase-like superfamily